MYTLTFQKNRCSLERQERGDATILLHPTYTVEATAHVSKSFRACAGFHGDRQVYTLENTAENHEKIESRFSIFLVEILGSFLDEKPESLVHTHGLLSKKALPAL